MPNHQQRRAPLPADYQFPTHGVECDCPSCRNAVVMPHQWWCGGKEPCACTEGWKQQFQREMAV